MRSNPTPSRRSLLQSTAILGGALAAGATLTTTSSSARGADELLQPAGADKSKPPMKDYWKGLKIGVASYTLRGMKIDPCIAAIQRVGIQYVSIKDMHLPLKSTLEERKAGIKKFKDAGITPLSCGVVSMQNDEANCRAAFEYARDIEVPVMVCDPHPDSFPILDKLVKEFDIKLAIHNHGPEAAHFKSPYDALAKAEKFDERIGLCIDVGHTARMKVDPAEAIHKCAPRLYDCHLKDIVEISNKNNGVEMGRGILNVRAMLQALLDIKFAWHAGFEYEKDGKDPVPGLAESVGYSRGVMSCL
jgi:sugar phosphate isomerase/epimerase